jgi:hypothetical protein
LLLLLLFFLLLILDHLGIWYPNWNLVNFTL